MNISRIIPCHGSAIPVFSAAKNKDLHKLVFSDNLTNNTSNDHPKPTSLKINKKLFEKEFLKTFSEINLIFDQSDNPIRCDYYDISDFKKMKKDNNRTCLSSI